MLEVNSGVFITAPHLGGGGPGLACGQPTGEEYVYPCDRVVLAPGHRPRPAPYGDRAGGGLQPGDPCGRRGERTDLDAVHAGYHGARRI